MDTKSASRKDDTNSNGDSFLGKIKNMMEKSDFDYFDMFVGAITISLDAAKVLKMASGDEGIDKEILSQIKSLEKKGDEYRSESLKVIETSFITPIDQVDMIEILEGIEDITDNIHYVANHFSILQIEKTDKYMDGFIEIILKVCQKTHDLMVAFKQFKKNPDDRIGNLVKEINELEEEGDRLYFDSMTDLFGNDNDTLTIVKKKEIYQLLEDTIDHCEDVADLVERTMLTE